MREGWTHKNRLETRGKSKKKGEAVRASLKSNSNRFAVLGGGDEEGKVATVEITK